jgi:hypothetical protein
MAIGLGSNPGAAVRPGVVAFTLIAHRALASCIWKRGGIEKKKSTN